ncbi:nSTAND1 domain-containing NTPase [Sorangium sp. So ce385]|uniref:nSTAND1 domain-containing NTPase n=1 Tax=Sorangium sp. So ce385 TaxID=3133308 RepID=UPI003F5C76F3
MNDARSLDDAAWSPPATFDGYRLLRLIGRGGMGSIYLAHDSLLDRPVAIKFIAAPRPDAVARQRFLIEARALARLSHPSVVAVHRVGEVDDRPYLVSEFIRGKSLAELEKPVCWRRALRLGLGLARGLGAAHRHGVLHRDIKPQNAMLGEAGELKLIDFGLAKLIEEPAAALGRPPPPSHRASSAILREVDGAASTVACEGDPASSAVDRECDRTSGTLTRADALLGTPLYMAPELLRGAPATRQSDVYALGAVLHELCTGAAHRAGVSPDAPLDDWIDAAPAPLESAVHGVDPRFAAAVARCLEPAPERRFGSGEALAEALELVDLEEPRAPIPEGNPYRGLRPFEAEHRALFFGREGDIRAVLDRLRAEPLVVIAGDSGVGKSSLCRAGVLPRVVEGALGDGRAFQAFSLVPGRRPLAALAAALDAVTLDEGALPPASGLRIEGDVEGLTRAVQRRMARARGALFFVDQLEELFTLAEPAEAARFAEALCRLGSLAAGVRVLTTVRGDFFTRLSSLPALGDELGRALYVLRPLGPDGIRAAITAPARRTGITFASEATVDALVEAGSAAAGGLPLLQFALAELWDARDPVAQRIPEAALEAIGGVAGALARHADAVVAALAPAEQAAARRILVRLVTAEGTRARRSAAELGLEDAAARAALEALIRGRLVVGREVREGTHRAPGGAPGASGTAYEVAHEALVRGWGALGAWLDRDREDRRERERIEVAAAEWARLGGASEALWSARQLAEAARVAEDALGPGERAFLSASRRRLRRTRLARALGVAAAPLVLGLALAGLEWKAQRDLDRVVAGHEAAARAAEGEGRRRKADADALRRRAFAGFDAALGQRAAASLVEEEAAERTWAEAVAAAQEAEEALARAGQALEAGLSLDPRRADLRAGLGDVLLEGIELAEWFSKRERRKELVRRLTIYDESGARQRRLVAPPRLAIEVTPPGASVTLGRYDADADGRRALRPVRALGRAPLPEIALDEGPGSYLLTFQAEGRADVRYPILLGRGERARVAFELPPAAAVPEGYVYVPPGRFLFGSADAESFRRGMLQTQPERELATGGYLIGRAEVTVGEWIRFLRDLPPAERAKRTPRERAQPWGVQLDELPEGGWALTLVLNGAPVTFREGEPLRIPGRRARAEQDWLRIPITSIALEDALAYTAWQRSTGRLPGARLCDEREWERAARGADERLYPHGDRLAPGDANFDETYGRVSDAYGPDEVGSRPASASPFGVMDLAGNAWEMARSAGPREELLVRGGAWYYDALSNRSSNRTAVEAQTRSGLAGLRVCADFPPRD